MDAITRRALMAQFAVTGFVAGAFDRMRRDDRGQGAVEYIGIIIAVAAMLVIVMAIIKGDVANGLKDAIKKAIDSVTGG